MVLFLSISNSDCNLEGLGDIQRARGHCPLHLSQYVCASASHEVAHSDIQLKTPRGYPLRCYIASPRSLGTAAPVPNEGVRT